MNALIWNIRSVKKKQAFERLINMNKQHHFQFIGIVEPKQKPRKLEWYRRKKGMLQACGNVSNKIWVFVDEDHDVDILINMEQQMTMRITNMDTQVSITVTFVYAKCDPTDRIELWDNMYYLARDMSLPWLVGGDFNMIWDEEKKFGGLPVSLNEVDDFRHCVTTCNLTDLGFKGSIYTWWNGRAGEDCIFKRLDRCLANAEFQNLMPALEITHLSKVGSDHSPMMLNCRNNMVPVKKPFRFLNFWTKHPTFKSVVKENWSADFAADPFIMFNLKLKKVKKALSTWSKATYGDIFQKIDSLEEVVLVHEAEFERHPTYENRKRLQKVQAELIRYLSLEEEFWRQKSGMAWFQDGDRNTKFFHAQVNGRRKRLQLKRIQNEAGIWLEEEADMAKEAIRFHQAQFHEESAPSSFEILQHIPIMVDNEKNMELVQQPTKEEIKTAVFGLSGEKAGGPDGFNGTFFHSCWDIIADDIEDMVIAFFNGHALPRFVTHTNLVLLPKKKEVETFLDMRPNSLSNFVNKIFSRVVHERLAGILPSLISEEQAGFVKRRSIVKNVLLTQEIVTDIRMRTKEGPNVVIKLDMTKAYDRLSWLFLSKVLRKMGSTRGVKQGDPLSPALFILAAEALSRGLNSLHNNPSFCVFGLPKWSLKINHLAYADDTIIFSSSDARSLQLIMQILAAYETASGQLINRSKSAIYMHHSARVQVIDKVQRITGIPKQEFPFTYLGCPIF
ncbi:PREDICTED: uncharacterized protein LOC109215174 [Nicotiana attenuata]|uniref:uncharacterized protein LOC109215174 n=1 Tax=Nicotiana attenuata TaxID=49451 RepID=UPI000905C92B|nr:PREDICTED: uncharacterized protein LOC109215174 [Nicotiana attenuata]